MYSVKNVIDKKFYKKTPYSKKKNDFVKKLKKIFYFLVTRGDIKLELLN